MTEPIRIRPDVGVCHGGQPGLAWMQGDDPLDAGGESSAFCERPGAMLLEGRKLTVTAGEVAYGWPELRAIASPASGGDG